MHLMPVRLVEHGKECDFGFNRFSAYDTFLFRFQRYVTERQECNRNEAPRPRGYTTFLCSTQLSTEFIMLKNVKCQQIGILAF